MINGYKDNESKMNYVTRLISNKNIATSVLIEYFRNLFFFKLLFVEVPAIKPITISTVQNYTPPSVDVRMILVYAIAVPSVIAILTLLIFIVYQKKNDGKSGIFRINLFILTTIVTVITLIKLTQYIDPSVCNAVPISFAQVGR